MSTIELFLANQLDTEQAHASDLWTWATKDHDSETRFVDGCVWGTNAVLRHILANRVLLTHHVDDEAGICGRCGDNDDGKPCLTKRVIAAPYARHAAFKVEWHVDPELDTAR